MKTFFRVNHLNTEQGLWYDFNGEFTGLIHNEFKFCKNNALQMEFDEEIVGFISAVETIEELYHWFSKEDILNLQERGFYIHEYQCDNYKWYDRFQHYVMSQKDAVLIRSHILHPDN